LPLLAADQAQKQVTHDEALLQLDALFFARLLDRDLSAPPATPADGDTYLVNATGSGGWLGADGKIAYALAGAWRFYAPFAGLTAFVVDEGIFVTFDGSAWVDYLSLLAFQNLPELGVNTLADSTNKFAVKSNAALLAALETGSGGTGDIRTVISKQAAGNTASFLFQDNFSGRAEIGLAGDDNFHFKVSPDGSSWIESIGIDRTTGKLTLGAGIAQAGLFHVYRSTGQSGFAQGAFSQLLCDTKEIDAASWYDNTTNFRYTPQEPGYYFFYCDCQLSYATASAEGAGVAIKKNGAIVKQGGPMLVLSSSLVTVATAYVGALVQMNGGADYVDFWVYAGSGSGGGTTNGGAVRNFAGGFKVSA
jgi:hypothetical protein